MKRNRIWKSGYFQLAGVVAMALATGVPAQPNHDHGKPAGQGAGKSEVHALIPSALQAEHQELHEMLGKAVKMKGPVGDAAKAVEKELGPHFRREEEIALPQLGALLALAEGREVEHRAHLLLLADSLRQEYPRMLEEHKTIKAALASLKAAAEKAKMPEYVRFAEGLLQHAQMEEQVMYPAALLVGRVLRTGK